MAVKTEREICFIVACQPVHAEHDIVLPILSVCLSVSLYCV